LFGSAPIGSATPVKAKAKQTGGIYNGGVRIFFFAICFVLKRAQASTITVSLFFLFTGACHGQSFVFVSPNTRGHMSGEFALESQDSFEQSNFVAVARYLAGKLCPRPEVWSGEGMDGTDTENTALITGCKSREAIYLGELLGRYAHQKWILIFNLAQKSDQRLFIIELISAQPANTIQEMHKYGLNEGTIISQNHGVRVFLWLKDNSKDSAVHTFADANHGKIQEIKGTGMLIGSESRRLAERVFDNGIAAYEHTHHGALAELLWSRKLHDLGDSPPVTSLKTP